MKKRLAVILAAGLASCGAPTRTDVPTAPSPSPDFSLQDLSGTAVRLADFRGRTVLLDFWATWCEPCKQSIPRYMKMQKKLRQKGFIVLGIDEGETTGTAGAYARRLGIDYPVLLDPDASLFHKYGGRSLPSAFLIDAQGNIRGRWDGFDAATGVDVEHATNVLLGAKPGK